MKKKTLNCRNKINFLRLLSSRMCFRYFSIPFFFGFSKCHPLPFQFFIHRVYVLAWTLTAQIEHSFGIAFVFPVNDSASIKIHWVVRKPNAAANRLHAKWPATEDMARPAANKETSKHRRPRPLPLPPPVPRWNTSTPIAWWYIVAVCWRPLRVSASPVRGRSANSSTISHNIISIAYLSLPAPARQQNSLLIHLLLYLCAASPLHTCVIG